MGNTLQVRLRPKDKHNIRRLLELTGATTASEVVRQALEAYRRATESRIAGEATRAAALQAEAT